MEEQYSFDINLDFLDPSTTNTQQNATTTEGYQQPQGQLQPVYDVETLANRIASVNDLVVQLKASKDENAKLQRQMQDLSDSAMSIRCMYEREKTEKAKYCLLSKELQSKCDQAESQLTNKTLHFEQLTSKIEQTTEKGPIAYNELALRYQRLAVQLEDDKLLNHKERISLQQIQDYIETKNLTPLPSFKKKILVHPKKQCHDYAMQCNLNAETKSQGTQSESVKSLKKEMCTQGTQYTWYTTTRGTNTPSPIKTALKEVKTKGTQYISSTTTRGTCTSAFIKTQTIGTNFPEVVPVSIEDIFKEMIFDGIPISPLPDNPKVTEEEEKVMSAEKVEMKTVGTNTGLKNVRKPIDYVSLSIKHSDSRPPSRNIYDRVKNESPFMAMPTMNQFVGMGMNPLPMNCTLADIWNILGQSLFGNGQLYPMHANLPNDRMRMNADMARRRERQRSKDELSNSSKDYFDEEVLSSPSDYLPSTRSIATSPISPRELQISEDYEVSEGTNFFNGAYIDPLRSSSAFVPVVRPEGSSLVKPNSPVEIQKIVLNKHVTGIEVRSKKSLQVDEILKLFPEYSHSLQKRKEIRKLLKTARKERKRTTARIDEESGIQRQKTDIQSDWIQGQFTTSREEAVYIDANPTTQYIDSSKSNNKEALEQSFKEIKSSKPGSDKVFLGFDDKSESSSDEVFCKPSLPPKRKQGPLVSNPYYQIENSEEQRMHIDGESEIGFETTETPNPFQQNDLEPQRRSGMERAFDVTHNVSSSLSKKIKRKRQTSTLDTKQSSKIHKVGESSSYPEPVIHSNSALSLNKTVVETKQFTLLGKRASPTPENCPNSTLSDQKTLNFNKTSTKSNQSSTIMRKHETAPEQQKLQEQKDMQSVFEDETDSNSHARQEMPLGTGRQITNYGDLLSPDENETDRDFNNRRRKPPDSVVCCKFPSPTPEKTVLDYNDTQEKPVDTKVRCKFRSRTPEETDWDFNERENNPPITGINIKLLSSNQHEKDWDFNDRQEKHPDTGSKCKSSSPTTEKTDSNFKDRQNKPLDIGVNYKFRSPTPEKTDWDFNERQNKPPITGVSFELPSPNQFETDPDFNKRQGKQPDTGIKCKFPSLTPEEIDSYLNDKQRKPLDTGVECKFRSPTPEETDWDFNERENNPPITGINIKLLLSNQHEKDWDFNDRQEKHPDTGSKCKFSSPTTEKTDSNFKDRQNKPLDIGVNYKFRSPTPEKTDWDFNERQNKPPITGVSFELPSPNQFETDPDFNKRQGKQPDTGIKCKFPSLTPEEIDSYLNDKQGKPLDTGVECKFRSPTPEETDWDFNERQNKRPKQKHMEYLVQDKATVSGQENSQIPIRHDQKTTILIGLQTAEEEMSVRSIFKGQESAPGQEINQIFIHPNQRTSKSNGVPAPKHNELSDSNSGKHSDGVIENQNPNEFPAPRQDQPINSAFYNERTSNTLFQDQAQNQRKFNTHGTTTIRLSNTNNITPTTISFSAPNSSDSELDLTIDCPKSPKSHDSSDVDLSSLQKTREKETTYLPQFKAPDDNCNGNYHTSSTENYEQFLLSESAETDKPKFQIFLTKILDEVATPLSPISVMAPSEKAIDSEVENSGGEEASQTPVASPAACKWKRKSPATAAIAVKRSARLKAKNKTGTGNLTKLSLSNIPGVQLGKYTKKKNDQRRPMKKLSEVEDVQEEKTDKKVDIICDIRLGYFKDLMDDEMAPDSCKQTRVIAEIPETTGQSNTCQDVSQKSEQLCQATPREGIYHSPSVELKGETMFFPKSEDVYQRQRGVDSYPKLPWQKNPTIHEEPKIFEQLQSTDRTPCENQRANEIFHRSALQTLDIDSFEEAPSMHEQTKIFEVKPKLILKNPSPKIFSFDECPASPPPMDQRPEEMHVTREIVESTSVTTKPTTNSMISHIIANYNPKHHKMLTQARQIDKKLLGQLQSIVTAFISGLCLVMDGIRTVDTLLNLTTSETVIAQALIGIVKTAARPEAEIPPPIPELYLSQTLRKLFSLLEPLYNRLPNLQRHLQAAIEQSLFTFRKDIMPLEIAMNLTQFYLAIIADPTATSNPARLFICKCLYFYNQKATPMIYETLCVYPSVLPKRDDVTYDRSDALINTIQCLLMSTFYDKEKTDLKSREMFTKLRKFYNYESFKPPREEVIENLMAKIRANRLKNVSYAFVLICKRMEQRNTEKLVLAEKLLPLANEYYHTLSQTTENDEKIACVLECISFIIKPFSVGTDISMYINLFGRFLNACDRQTIQEAALAALLRTIRFGYVHCFNTIYNFKPNYELASSTKAMLKSFVYKKNLDFLKRLEHQAHVLVTT